jgi:hypothetical protein
MTLDEAGELPLTPDQPLPKAADCPWKFDYFDASWRVEAVRSACGDGYFDIRLGS